MIVGELLAQRVEGSTLAERIIAGEDIELDAISVNGSALPLEAGFRLSLDSISSWGCPACHSAHGSGVFPSREADVAGLEKCRFYYNPRTMRIFTISKTCWREYVEDLGASGRFIEVPVGAQSSVVETDRVSEGVGNLNDLHAGPSDSRLHVHDGLSGLPIIQADSDAPPRPDRLAKLAEAGLYTKGLERQAAGALPVLLSKLEKYLQACAHRGYRSALLISGKEPPFVLDQVRCSEWTDAHSALRNYFHKYERVVDADNVRQKIVNHFRSLGFRVERIADPHQVRILHLGWFLQWLLPRDTVRVSW